ncbi:MAG TPA: DUF4375 domain-containing protein [Myxococcota bacterium]|jgi:Domain of unknown function (DUF4375)|nr:DUF4375 domain-containing protein [Myxococcota bacterium]
MRTIQDVLAHADAAKLAVSLGELLGARETSVGYDALSRVEQIALCVEGLEREVSHGGFEQYFASAAGDHALDCVDALDEIGGHEAADLLRRALMIFGAAGPDPDREERTLQLEAMGERVPSKLEPLDDAFFDDHDDLKERMRAFVQSNVKGFSPASDV